jgi:hypothetical protein
MMRAIWRYVQIKKNRELLAFVCGGAAAVIASDWGVYTHFSGKKPENPQITISAPGGVAAQSITGSPIAINPPSPAQTPMK